MPRKDDCIRDERGQCIAEPTWTRTYEQQQKSKAFAGATFGEHPCDFVRSHLPIEELSKIFQQAEKAKAEKLYRICIDKNRLHIEEIPGVATTEVDKRGLSVSHYDITESPWRARKGQFLSTVHPHPPYVNGEDEKLLAKFSHDDLNVIRADRYLFILYPSGKNIMLGCAYQNKQGHIRTDVVEIGKQKS